MKTPYAKCNFAAIRTENYFYIDKTQYIAHIENAGQDHLIFLRPRRFGKTTLLSTLERYYDIARSDRFDTYFGGLWIHEHPTPGKNKYFVLTLDLSPVDTIGEIDHICKSFAHQVRESIKSFIVRYSGIIPLLSELEAIMASLEGDPAAWMTSLLRIVGTAEHQVYLLIDEYDHFGNRLLADDRKTTYQKLVESSGFVRSFYASVKAFTRDGTLARTFITGVSPIMLDDLSSGFNIVRHISMRPIFNAMVGFTRAEVEFAIDALLRDMPQLAQDPRLGDRTMLLDKLEKYYNGYRFSPHATERVYNSTLVLYFLSEIIATGYHPRNMLDLNVRTDYGRLDKIAQSTSERASDVRELLEEILTKKVIKSPLVEQFGTKLHMGRAQVASLFYYMGMLTFAEGRQPETSARLVIPNRVMRELQWEYMSFALEDHDNIELRLGALNQKLNIMAETGDIQPLLALFREDVIKRLGLRETINFNEQTMKLMLFSYLSLSGAFFLMTEKESAQGYCDLLLGLRGDDPDNQYAWILEAKYVKSDQKEDVIENAVQEAFDAGRAQIEKYAADKDLVPMLTKGFQLKAGVLVFVGLKDLRYCEVL